MTSGDIIMYEDSYIAAELDTSTFENDCFDDADLPAAPESWGIEDFDDILSTAIG